MEPALVYLVVGLALLLGVLLPKLTAQRAVSPPLILLAVGVGAFFLRRRGYQMAPFVLGLVLGTLLDKSLRRGLVLSDGSIAPFFTRPICAVFAVVTFATMLLYIPAVNALLRRALAGARALVGLRQA